MSICPHESHSSTLSRSLSIADSCPDKIGLYRTIPERPPKYTDNRLLCGLFNDRLFDCLQGLPILQALTITQEIADHGLSWITVKRLLSLSRLRSLSLWNLYFCPTWRDTDHDRSSKQKLKKRKEQSKVKEERPLTHGAHGVARQDGVSSPKGMYTISIL